MTPRVPAHQHLWSRPIAGLALVAAAALLGACGSVTAPVSSPTITASPTPAPASIAMPTADAGPPLAFPDLQSHGTATISFSSPATPPVTYQLACFWTPEWYDDYDVDSGVEKHEFQGATLAGVRALEPFAALLAGEPADVWLGVGPELGDVPSEWHPGHLLIIHRHGAASYVAGPTTGTVELVEASADRTSGTIRFERLAPDPETTPPGEAVLADWIKPLGGDPVMASLSGTLSWQCDPAPDTIATYDLYDEGWPEGWPSIGEPPFGRCDAYPLVLVSGAQSRSGVGACVSPCDSCGPDSFFSLDADQTVTVPVGGTLRFELADPGTHFIRWSLRWATQSEAELATQHEEEGDYEFASPFKLIDEGRYSEGPILEFPAPPPGEWSVSLGWHDHPAGYESGNLAFGTDYFRVIVGD